MRISRTQMESLATSGGNVVAADGQKIGSIGQVYVDDSTGEPSFVTVKTGLFGTAESFVPLQDATVTGSDIRVAYNKTEVKDAPRIDPDERITPKEEQRLYAHYDISSPRGHTSGTERTGPSDTGDYGTSSNDTSGSTTDDAMTRSEERLKVGTRKEEAGQARLRKYVVTENVTQTVPVSREEVRVEREPITDKNVGAARSGPNISEEEHEVVLHQERPVVEKEAVPVERVRLGTETVTDQETVSEDVRKEQIDTDLDRGRTRRRSDR
ncbi:MAG TPA: PRC and DUF2382 domain-containing protein [Propionibacteriaceae bacterium]